jgi:hypothetical protein
VAPALRPELRVGGKVVDGRAAGDGSADGIAVADVGPHEVNAVERQVLDLCARPFEDADGFAAVDE